MGEQITKMNANIYDEILKQHIKIVADNRNVNIILCHVIVIFRYG